MTEPRPTVLADLHRSLGGRMVDFAGWLLPVQYQGILAEHRHCRQATALFDTCHMGQFHITGADAQAALAGAITVDATTLKVGRGKYGFLLNAAGGVCDDVILMRLADDDFLLVVNAGTASNDEVLLRERLGRSAELAVLSDWGKLDVQGPGSHDALAPLVEGDPLADLSYFACRRAVVNGTECILSRTGYTGELGYEIFMPGEALPALFEALLERPGVNPAGLGARDSLRLEMSYPLYGHELDEQTNPLEADLGFAAKLDGGYVGADALRSADTAGLARHLVALRTDQRRQFHPGDAILSGDQPIGQVTSGAFSPSLNAAIGMGYVPPQLAKPGTQLTVRTERADIPAIVATKPIYTEGTCRKKL